MADYVKGRDNISTYFPRWHPLDVKDHNKEHRRCCLCRYGVNCGGLYACYYIVDTGHRRPCKGESKNHKCECFDPRVELRAERTEQMVVSFKKYYKEHNGNI